MTIASISAEPISIVILNVAAKKLKNSKLWTHIFNLAARKIYTISRVSMWAPKISVTNSASYSTWNMITISSSVSELWCLIIWSFGCNISTPLCNFVIITGWIPELWLDFWGHGDLDLWPSSNQFILMSKWMFEANLKNGMDLPTVISSWCNSEISRSLKSLGCIHWALLISTPNVMEIEPKVVELIQSGWKYWPTVRLTLSCCCHAGWKRWMPSSSHYLTFAADKLESTETSSCFAECVVSRTAVSTVADSPLTPWQLRCRCPILPPMKRGG